MKPETVKLLESESVAAISCKQWGTTWRAYAGGLGAEPRAGSRGRAPGQGSGGLPPEAERKLNFDNTITRLILHYRVSILE